MSSALFLSRSFNENCYSFSTAIDENAPSGGAYTVFEVLLLKNLSSTHQVTFFQLIIK